MTARPEDRADIVPPNADHVWFLSRLLASRLGALSDEEASRFEAHRRSCAECAAIWNEYATLTLEVPGGPPHIASRTLLRWAEGREDLQELTIHNVEQHLQVCAECRSALEAMGFEGKLQALPGRSPRRSRARGDALSAWRRAAAGIRHWKSRDWLVGGWAAAASAACLVLVLRTPVSRPPRAPNEAVLPWVAAERVRGPTHAPDVASPSTLSVSASTRQVLLRIPVPPEMMPAGAAELEVRDPDGRSVLRVDIDGSELARGSLTVLFADSQPLQPGRYRTVLSSQDPPGVSDERAFTLRRDTP